MALGHSIFQRRNKEQTIHHHQYRIKPAHILLSNTPWNKESSMAFEKSSWGVPADMNYRCCWSVTLIHRNMAFKTPLAQSFAPFWMPKLFQTYASLCHAVPIVVALPLASEKVACGRWSRGLVTAPPQPLHQRLTPTRRHNTWHVNGLKELRSASHYVTCNLPPPMLLAAQCPSSWWDLQRKEPPERPFHPWHLLMLRRPSISIEHVTKRSVFSCSRHRRGIERSTSQCGCSRTITSQLRPSSSNSDEDMIYFLCAMVLGVLQYAASKGGETYVVLRYEKHEFFETV